MIRVFLSHNSADKPQVEHIAHKLQKAGFSPWLDAWNLSPGDKWQEGLEQGLINSQVCLVFIGKNGRGPWHDAEIYAAVDKSISHKQIRVIPVLLPDAPDNVLGELPLFLQSYNAERFTSLDDPKAFRRLCAGIREEAPGPDIDCKKTLNPYRGLDFFDLKHSEFFHGREEITGRLLDLLRPKSDYLDEANNHFLAIIGASGSGKSSIARAGLLAALQDGRIEGSESWPQIVCTPGKEPLESLAITLNSHQDLKSRWDTHELIDKLKTQPLQLHYLTLELLQGDKQRRLVLLIDQFEEIFTLCESKEDRNALVTNILRAAKEETGQLIIVITLRADFYSHCTAYPELSRYFEVQQRLLNPMSEQELRSAIEQPARQVGCELEQGLVDVIISDAQQQPGTLPLLQYALMRLWDQSSSKVLRLKDYQAFGGLGGALEQRANELYKEFPQAMQNQCRLIFRRLVQPGEGTTDTRRRSRLEELGDSAETLRVIQTLTDARLLTTQENSGTAFVEVSHEALIREWSQLQEWIEEDRSDLRLQHQITSAAQDWQDHEREDSWLFTGARLAAAVEWVKENTDNANELETAFIYASKQTEDKRQQAETKLLEDNAELEKQRRVEAEKREKEQSRALIRSRWMSGVMTLLTVAMLVISWFAYQAENKATIEAGKSEKSRKETEKALVQVEYEKEKTEIALKEAETAKQSAENSAKEARKKELEANYNLSKAFEEKSLSSWEKMGSDSMQARSAVLFALDAQTKEIAKELITIIPPSISKLVGMNEHHLFSEKKITPSLGLGGVFTMALSPGGKLIATSGGYGSDYVISIWEINTGKLLNTLSGHESIINSLSFNHSGNKILSGSSDKTIKLWDVGTGKQISSFDSHNGQSVAEVMFRPNSNQFASSSYYDRKIKVHDEDTGEIVLTIDGSNGDFSYSPNGKVIAGGIRGENVVKLWDSSSGEVITILEGHTETISNLAFSPDSMTLATASYDKSVRYWRLSDGMETGSLSTGSEVIDRLVYSPNGKILALAPSNSSGVYLWDVSKKSIHRTIKTPSASANDIAFGFDGKDFIAVGMNFIQVWNIETEEARYDIYHGHKGSINAIAYSPIDNFIATAGWDSLIHFWDSENGKKQKTINTPSTVYDLSFSPNGKQIAVGHNNGLMTIWDVATGKLVLTIPAYTPEEIWSKSVKVVLYSPDGNSVATGAGWHDDNKIKLWNVRNGNLVKEFEFPGSATKLVKSIGFSLDGSMLVSGDQNGKIIVWDVATGNVLNALNGHTDSVTKVLFSSDGGSIISASSDSTIRFWDAKAGKQIKVIQTNRPILDLSYSSNGKFLATSLNDKTIRLWNAQDGKLNTTFWGRESSQRAVFSPDGSNLAASSKDGALTIWDIKPAPDKVLLGHKEWIPTMVFDPNGKWLASGSADHTVRLWDLDSLKSKIFKGHNSLINALAVSYDGEFLVSASHDDMIHIWDVGTGKIVNSFEQSIEGDAQVTALAFSKRTELLITGNAQGNVQLIDFKNGKIKQQFEGDNWWISDLALSPDDQTLIAGSRNNDISVWSVEGGKRVATLKDHQGEVNSIAFSPNGELFASGSSDKTIRIWDAKTLKTTKVLKGHTKRVFKVSFSPDGKTLTSSSSDNTVRQWDTETGKLMNVLRGGYMHAHHPTKKILVSAYGSVIRLWGQTDPMYRLFYDFDPGAVSAALKFLWQLELDGLDYKHVDYPKSLKPEMGYHIAWTDETRKFRPLLDAPESGETKLEQVVRWLDEQKAYRKTPAGLPVTH